MAQTESSIIAKINALQGDVRNLAELKKLRKELTEYYLRGNGGLLGFDRPKVKNRPPDMVAVRRGNGRIQFAGTVDGRRVIVEGENSNECINLWNEKKFQAASAHGMKITKSG